MLNQAIQWLQMAGTAAEAILLVRLLTLKLQRLYVFVTLYWAVNLLFDVAQWILGWTSPATVRLQINALFLFAFLFPFAAWDAFEEIKPAIEKIRRVHAPRLISGLFITALLGLIWFISLSEDAAANASPKDWVGLFVWLGSACACLLFIWKVYRSARKQAIALPRNTVVWAIFFMLTLGQSILQCVVFMARPVLKDPAPDIIESLFLTFELCLYVWCAIKLRPWPSDVTREPEKASIS